MLRSMINNTKDMNSKLPAIATEALLRPEFLATTFDKSL